MQGHEETLCLDCAVAMAHPGCKMFILCSKQIKELEDRARWLEQHSLLKGRTAGTDCHLFHLFVFDSST